MSGTDIGDSSDHVVVAVPIFKLGHKGGSEPVAWRFACSCGRVGNGWHRTPEQAVKYGHDHVPSPNAKQGCLGPDSSFTGVDGTDIADPDKVWRCDSCRATGTSDVLAEWSGHNPNSAAGG